jgi:aldose 1-epimerase
MKLNHYLGSCVLLLATATSAAQTKITQQPWGKTSDGSPVQLFTLADHGLTVKLITYGAHVISIEAPDRNGAKADVVLGYDSIAGYEADKSTYMGSIVGRYGNRIAGGKFTIDGQTYTIPLNEKTDALHGGPVGFDRKIWTGREIPNGVEMTLVSPDGDMGFPGTLTTHVRYTLTGDSLHIGYSATTTKPTVVNLTNHSYFNLAGKGTVLDEVVTIHASRYTPIDANLIPTSKLDSVVGTPFDFLKPTAIGVRIDDDNQQLHLAGGYDHNFVLDGPRGTLHPAAHAYDPSSGRTLTVTTTEPGVQFYSGNFLDGTKIGKAGVAYQKHDGFCLETQHFPDSPNEPAFPSTVLRPGQTMHSETVFTFGVQK